MNDDVIGERYRRSRYLGRGAVGEVWLAEDLLLGRQVALKRLRLDPADGGDGADMQRMMREARVAARAHHPNIVSVFDLVVERGQPHLVMEYVDGESLAERIKREGRIPVDQARKIVREVADALVAAHALGIVHRDVKPANILIDRHGTAKLADFGVARGQTDAAITDTGLLVGTVAYMAPEVARGEHATFASDIWSLGATLYAATEGRAPHDDGSSLNPTAVLVRLVTEPIPAPQAGAGLAPVIMDMLQFLPEDRPSAAEVVQRLGGTAATPIPDQSRNTDQVVVPGQPAPADDEDSEATRRRPALANLADESDPTGLRGQRVVPPPAGAAGHRAGGPGGRGRGRRRTWLIVAAVIALGVGVPLAVLLVGRGRSSSEPSHGPVQPAAKLAQDGASGAFSPDGRTAYIPAGAAIDVIDNVHGRATGHVTLPADLVAQSIRVLPDGTHAVVDAWTAANGQPSNTAPGAVVFVDLAHLTAGQPVSLCGAPLPRGAIFSADAARFFVSTRTCDEIIDVGSHAVVWSHTFTGWSASVVPTLLTDGHTVEFFDRVLSKKRNSETSVPVQLIESIDMSAQVPQPKASVVGIPALATQGLLADPSSQYMFVFTTDNESSAGQEDTLAVATMKPDGLELTGTFFPRPPQPAYPVGIEAQSAAVTPGGRYVLVLSTGYNAATKQQGPAELTILDTDAPRASQVSQIPLRGQGWGMFAFSPDGSHVLVSTAASHTISYVDIGQHREVRTISGGPLLYRSKDGTVVYASTDTSTPTVIRVDAWSGQQLGSAITAAR